MSEQSLKKPGPVSAKSLFSAGGLAIMLVILVLVNVVFSKINLRWDATEDKLYSLSDGTKSILSKIQNDVYIKIFYTKDEVNTPVNIKTFATRLLDFLSEYEYQSGGKVTVEVYDTRADSEEEDWARKYGIQPVDLPTGDRLYFGLVATCGDQEESMPIIDPSKEENLEYDITRMIYRVQSPKKSRIGIISSLPVFGEQIPPQLAMQRGMQGSEPWLFIEELRKTYVVEEIPESSETIENGIDLLMVMHPKQLSDPLLYAIDQYVLGGGNAVVLLDGFALSENAQGMDRSSSLDKLLKAWGVTTEPGKVVADFDHATRVNRNNQVEENPLFLSMQSDSLNKDDIITSKLDSILLPVSGVLKKLPDSKYEYEALVQSSENSTLTENFRVQFGTNQIRKDFTPSKVKYDLIVKVRGMFDTAFPEGKPKPKDDNGEIKPAEETAQKGLTKGEKKSTIIVSGDSDLIFDQYYVAKQSLFGFQMSRMFNDNLNFILNSCEMLTGSEDLIGVRSRGSFERPFTTVKELEKKAQEKWLSREQELVREAEEANRKLSELEQKKDPSQQYILTAEQEAEIKKFQEKKQQVNKDLKIVRRNLRSEIESLGNSLKFINILLVPMLVAGFGITYGILMRRKARRQ